MGQFKHVQALRVLETATALFPPRPRQGGAKAWMNYRAVLRARAATQPSTSYDL